MAEETREEMHSDEVKRATQETTYSGEGALSRIEIEAESTTTTMRQPSGARKLVFISCVAIVALAAILALLFWHRGQSTGKQKECAEASAPGEEKESKESKDIVLSAEAIKAAGIEIAGVTERPAVALLSVTGTVETNQQQTPAATPLVGGRVERVNVALGDRVRAGRTWTDDQRSHPLRRQAAPPGDADGRHHDWRGPLQLPAAADRCRA